MVSSINIAVWANMVLDYAQSRFCRKTYNDKKLCFKMLGKKFGKDMLVEELTPLSIEAHFGEQLAKRSPNAANKDRKNLANAWNLGVKYIEGFPSKPNPFSAVDKFPEVRKERYVPPLDDVRKVVQCCEGQDQLMLLAYLMTGARRAELWNLKWQDVDFENTRIRLWTRKRVGGLEYDYIPMPKVLKEMLSAWQQEQPVKSSYVFVNLWEQSPSYGQPFKDRRNFLIKKCEEAGVRVFGYHALRHIAASKLYKDSGKLHAVKTLMRHRNSNTTDQYLKSLGFEDAAEAFDESLGQIAEFAE